MLDAHFQHNWKGVLSVNNYVQEIKVGWSSESTNPANIRTSKKSNGYANKQINKIRMSKVFAKMV